MSRPLAEWELRAARYGAQRPQITNQYEMARLRASSQRPGPLTMGQEVFRDVAYFAVGGVALKGLQALHYGIKGARVIHTVRRGKPITLYRLRPGYTGRRGFISRESYRNRPGLLESLRTPDRAGRRFVKRVETRIASTRTYRGYSKLRSLQELTKGPMPYLIHRYTPRSVKMGFGVYSAYRWAGAFWPSDEPGTETVSSGPRADPNFILNQRLPHHLGSTLHKKSGSRAPRYDSKSKRGCPPGHRWSSRLRTCVRVGRR